MVWCGVMRISYRHCCCVYLVLSIVALHVLWLSCHSPQLLILFYFLSYFFREVSLRWLYRQSSAIPLKEIPITILSVQSKPTPPPHLISFLQIFNVINCPYCILCHTIFVIKIFDIIYLVSIIFILFILLFLFYSRPSTFSGQRALNFVLDNQNLIDKTLLINIRLIRVDKDYKSS